MEGKVVVIGILAMLLFSGLAMATNPQNSPISLKTEVVMKGMRYTAHDVIRINGDGDFDSAHGVVGGSGTQSDPYIISGWEIDAHGAGNAMYIGNTTAHFIVEQCTLYNATEISWPYNEGAGLSLYNVTNGTVRYNNMTDKGDKGIFMLYSDLNVLENNNISNVKYWGIELYSSNNNRIFNNNMSNAGIWGLSIEDSAYNIIGGNKMKERGIYLSGSFNTYTTQEIYQNNTVNGKPVYHYKNANMDNASVPADAGEVILGNVSWLVVENLQISNSTEGIVLGYSSNVYIRGNTFTNQFDGISIYSSSRIVIAGNNITNNRYGVFFQNSNSNNVTRNNISDNHQDAIRLWGANNNNIVENTIAGNLYATEIKGASNNLFKENNIYNNNYGVSIGWSTSTKNVVIGNNITSNNYYGIGIYGAKRSAIYNNNISNNGRYGVYIYSGSNNTIYNNVFYHNNGSGDSYSPSHVQAYDAGTNNSWNTTSGYGNYWYDWANNNDTNDQDGNGIVDWAYTIDGSAGARDYFPLKNPSQPIPEFPNVEILIPILVILLIGFVWRRRK